MTHLTNYVTLKKIRNSLGILRYKIADIFLEWMIKVSFSVFTNFGNFGISFFFLNFFYKDPENFGGFNLPFSTNATRMVLLVPCNWHLTNALLIQTQLQGCHWTLKTLESLEFEKGTLKTLKNLEFLDF